MWLFDKWRGFALRRFWCGRAVIWTVGALLIWGVVRIAGPSIVLWEFTRLALLEEEPFQMTQRLMAPRDLGGPRARTLMALLEQERPDVRRVASGLLTYTPEPHEPIPGLSDYYDDPDPAVSMACLVAGADRGDCGALRRLYERFTAADPASEDYGVGRTLAHAGFREAGDEVVERIPSAGGQALWALLNRIEGMLRHRGFVGSRGVMADGAFVTTERQEPLSADEERGLAGALTNIWRIARTEYRTIAEFCEGDRLFRPQPHHSFKGYPGRRVLLLHLLGAQALWAAGFWLAAIVRHIRARGVLVTSSAERF